MDLERHFRKGFAVGRSDIRAGAIWFRFYREIYQVSRPIRAKRVNDYLIAPVTRVRRAADG